MGLTATVTGMLVIETSRRDVFDMVAHNDAMGQRQKTMDS